MKILIFGSGEINSYDWIKNYLGGRLFVICCDGGCAHANALGLLPDLIIGDFDSVDNGLLEFYKGKNVSVITYSTEKDVTDMEAGLDLALERPEGEILIFGGSGSRFDHTLVNVHLLVKAKHKNPWLLGETFRATLITGEKALEAQEGNTLTLIPLTGSATGITTCGLKYPLYRETLDFAASRGSSNVFVGSSASVTLETGILLAVISEGDNAGDKCRSLHSYKTPGCLNG